MKNIYIEGFHGSYYVPTVNFDAQKGICEISGESYLEDTIAFFSPLVDWLTEFLETQDKPLTFNFNLDYYNTSSSKYIVDILSLLKKYQDSGKKITVNWYYNENSEDADEEIEEVEDFMLETGMKINLVPYKK